LSRVLEGPAVLKLQKDFLNSYKKKTEGEDLRDAGEKEEGGTGRNQ